MKPRIYISILIVLNTSLIFLEAQESLRILTTDYPPFQYEEDGNVVGVSTEIVDSILDRAGLIIPIFIYPWARTEYELNSVPNTLSYNLSRTTVRENKYIWLADITPTNIYIWKKKSRKDIAIDSYENLNDYIIGVMPNVVSHQFLLEQGVDESAFFRTSYLENLIKMLIAGRIDLLPLDEISFNYIVSHYGSSPDQFEKVIHLKEISSKSYLVASQGTSAEVIDKINRAWESIKRDGTYQTILKNYINHD